MRGNLILWIMCHKFTVIGTHLSINLRIKGKVASIKEKILSESYAFGVQPTHFRNVKIIVSP